MFNINGGYVMTNELLAIYSDGEIHSNDEVYQIMQTVDDNEKHIIRGLQQNLKKSGFIENYGYRCWKLVQ